MKAWAVWLLLCVGLWGSQSLRADGTVIAKSDFQSLAAMDALPQRAGKTFDLAQTILPLPNGQFAVGRWDGALQLWDLPRSRSSEGPTLRSVSTLPSRAGVLALVKIEEGLVLSSHDQGSLALWTQTEDGFALRSIVEFPSQLGEVTSGALVALGTQKVIVVGHASGFVSLWKKTRWSLAWLGQTDVRSPSPVPSPYALRHIRAVVPWKDGLVLLGSEDGDVTQLLLRLVAHGVDAVVIHRARYSQTAQRGINGLALSGDLLAVTSCAVGSEPNLHLLRVEPGRLVPLDALELKRDSQREQVFAFAVVATDRPSGKTLWVSTQEGLVWQVTVVQSKLRRSGFVPASSGVGTALFYDKERQLLVAVGHEATVLRVPYT
jgi:hypothetical protein